MKASLTFITTQIFFLLSTNNIFVMAAEAAYIRKELENIHGFVGA